MASMAASEASAIYQVRPVPTPRRSLFTRLRWAVRLWAFKIFVHVGLNVARRFKLRGLGVHKATLTKRYESVANLEHEVWFPDNYKSGQQLPLYIDVHGGGFAIGEPMTDAPWCYHLANTHNVIVVSLNYRKSPLYPFPFQTQDIASAILSVLNDPSLPIDHDRVALGGFSAGANLSLSASLYNSLRADPTLQAAIKGLVLFYPVTDFSGRYKGTFQPSSDGTPDILARTSALFNWGYVPIGQDRTDPLLSPIYASPTLLPPKIIFVGAQHDILCKEAEITAQKYATFDRSSNKPHPSSPSLPDIPDPIPPTTKTPTHTSWTQNNITFITALDVAHGFNFVPKKEPKAEEYRQQVVKDVYAKVGAWLVDEVYG